jgi:autophagy-related protein 2
MNFLRKVKALDDLCNNVGEDIGHFAEPPKPAGPVEKGTFGEFEEQIRVFGGRSHAEGSGSVRFVEEHFPTHSVLPENSFLTSDSLIKVRLRNTRVVWNLHDGYDWPKTRDAIALAVQKLEQRAAEALAAKARRKTPHPTRTVTLPELLYGDDPWTFDEEEEDDVDDDSEIGDILFNSIYVGVRRGQDPKMLARNINRDLDAQSETTSQVSTTPSSPMRSSRGASPGFAAGNPLERARGSAKSLRLKRSKSQKVQINLRNLAFDFDLLSEPLQAGNTILSTVRLKVGDLEILDNVPTSSWNKFVTYWRGADKRRETASAMVDLEIANVKPVQHLSASELVIKVHLRIVC